MILILDILNLPQETSEIRNWKQKKKKSTFIYGQIPNAVFNQLLPSQFNRTICQVKMLLSMSRSEPILCHFTMKIIFIKHVERIVQILLVTCIELVARTG